MQKLTDQEIAKLVQGSEDPETVALALLYAQEGGGAQKKSLDEEEDESDGE